MIFYSLSVAPGDGLFLFVHDNILKSDAMPIEEMVNFFNRPISMN